MTADAMRNILRHSGPIPVCLNGSEWCSILAGLELLSEDGEGVACECERLFGLIIESFPADVARALERLADLRECERN